MTSEEPAEYRSTTVAGPDPESHTSMVHSTPFDEVTPAFIEQTLKGVRAEHPEFPEIPPYSQMYSGRAVSPDGKEQLYLVSHDPLTDEDRMHLMEFELTGQWFARRERDREEHSPAGPEH